MSLPPPHPTPGGITQPPPSLPGSQHAVRGTGGPGNSAHTRSSLEPEELSKHHGKEACWHCRPGKWGQCSLQPRAWLWTPAPRQLLLGSPATRSDNNDPATGSHPTGLPPCPPRGLPPPKHGGPRSLPAPHCLWVQCCPLPPPFTKEETGEFPGRLVVRILGLLPWPGFNPLVGELRSCKPSGAAKTHTHTHTHTHAHAHMRAHKT